MRADDPVSKVMTESVLAVDVTDSVREVVRLFTEYPIHHLPVVSNGRLVGMLSSADMLKLQFFAPPGKRADSDYINERLRIENVMHKDVVSVEAQQTLEEAAGLMASRGVHALPVTSPGGFLIGIVTTTDVMNALLQGALRRDAAGTGAAASSLTATEDQRRTAMNAAARLISEGQDVHAIGHVLLSLDSRVRQLDEIRIAAERFLRAGQDEHLHGALQRLLERLPR